MLRPKNNSYKEFDKEKKFLGLKNPPPPPPPITFLTSRDVFWLFDEAHQPRSE